MPDLLERRVDRIPRLLRIVLAIGFAWFSLANHVTATLDRDPGDGRGDVSLADVRDAGLFPARAWIDGVNPWDPVAFRAYDARIGQDFPLYSPVHVAMHLPLAPAPIEGAREAWYWLSLLLTVGLARSMLVVAGRRPTIETTAVTFGAVLWSHPGALSLVSGQSGVVLALGAIGALVATSPALMALGAVAVLTKPTFGVPVVVMMLARGRVRGAIVGSAVAATVSVVMLARLVAAEGLGELLDGFSRLATTAPIGSGKRVDLASDLARLTNTTPPLAFELVVGAVVLAAAFVLVRRVEARAPGSVVAPALALCVPCLVLFHGSWDLVTVVPAFVLLLAPDPAGRLGDAPRAVVLALLAYALANPWGRRFSEGLYGDRLTGILAATVRSWAFVAAVGVLALAALRPVGRPAGPPPMGVVDRTPVAPPT